MANRASCVRPGRVGRPLPLSSLLYSVHDQSQARSYATAAKPTRTIGLIPGDGVGKEIVPEAQRVLESSRVKGALGFNLNLVDRDIDAGWETFTKTGKALPDATLATLRKCDGALFGAVSSPSQRVAGYSSPIIGMRTALDLYANLRPSVSAPQIATSRENVDLLIVRENTECLYVKQERTVQTDKGLKAIADRVITQYASTRIAEMAFKQAVKRAKARQQNGDKSRKSLLTIVHKSNVLSVTDGLFRESCLEVSKKYAQEVDVEEQLVDSMVYKIILNPSHYDVVVAPNLYGDIVSDAAAALVGGLGLAPSANVGDSFILAEPVHGSAPDIAGKGIVNPLATLRATAMLLRYLEEREDVALDSRAKSVASALEAAITQTLRDGPRTPDLGGSASTRQVTDAVIANLQL